MHSARSQFRAASSPSIFTKGKEGMLAYLANGPAPCVLIVLVSVFLILLVNYKRTFIGGYFL